MSAPPVSRLCFRAALAALVAVLAPWSDLHGQSRPGELKSYEKISNAGGFPKTLKEQVWFGYSVDVIGDVNDNGVPDLAVGAPLDGSGGRKKGAVWVLFMAADGAIASARRISETQGGLSQPVQDEAWFGYSVAGLGDHDGDGVEDLAVGMRRYQVEDVIYGGVWLICLNANGTVKSDHIIEFVHELDSMDRFGASIQALGDLNGDGVGDIAVGAPGDDDGGSTGGFTTENGAVWILFLEADGTVTDFQKISATEGGLGYALDDISRFGTSLASPGDFDGDGNTDLLVGASGDLNDPDGVLGSVWLLLLRDDGTVRDRYRIWRDAPGFTATYDGEDAFGSAVTSLGDLDGDGVTDIAIGARHHGDSSLSQPPGPDIGAVWIVLLNADGTVKDQQLVTEGVGNFPVDLEARCEMGHSLAGLGDWDGDGIVDVAAGAPKDDDGDFDAGALWMFALSAASWTDLGNGLPGSGGTPSLLGSGPLVADTMATLELTGAPPNGATHLVLGVSPLLAPFKGGVLVPSPDLLVFGLPLDGDGALSLGFPWPSGVPGGAALWYQFWTADPLGPAGFSASNGVSGEAP